MTELQTIMALSERVEVLKTLVDRARDRSVQLQWTFVTSNVYDEAAHKDSINSYQKLQQTLEQCQKQLDQAVLNSVDL